MKQQTFKGLHSCSFLYNLHTLRLTGSSSFGFMSRFWDFSVLFKTIGPEKERQYTDNTTREPVNAYLAFSKAGRERKVPLFPRVAQ